MPVGKLESMEALVVIDAQNDFSPDGAYPATGYSEAVEVIRRAVEDAHSAGRPVVWIRHENAERNSRFEPGSWGADLDPSLAPLAAEDAVFTKTVFGAFTGTPLETTLREQGADAIRLVGFLTHMCVSTTAREALMLGLPTVIQADGCSSRPIENPGIGRVDGDEAHRVALLHLASMGASIEHELPA
jgi:nicotinamidase-related amidase